MTRLQGELQRLYLSSADVPGRHLRGASAEQQVRTMVLEVSGPSPWEHLAKVWQGVQADLELAAPAIAITGEDAYQLWFSLAEPVPAADAVRFLALLRDHYLPDVRPERIRTVPSQRPGADEGRKLPPFEASPGRWSAFVTSDLAALFADEPSLDMPPGEEAQADLLSRVHSMKPADLQRALERLAAPTNPGTSTSGAETAVSSAPGHPEQDPRRFLLSVMNDAAVELHLRIEAAKALLPYSPR